MRVLARRRSCLCVPGGSDKMLARAQSLAADEIVFDLEDGVAASEKSAARDKVVSALSGSAFAERSVAVRINAIGTPWCHEDIVALGALAHPRLTLVVPKLENRGDLAFLHRFLLGLETAHRRPVRIGLQGLIETATGLANVARIASASPRLESLILGYADLASSLGRDPAAGWAFAQDGVLLAARSNGLLAIDGPYFDYRQEATDALTAASVRAADLGFDGKWAIHPSQVAPIEAAFTPGPAALAHARAILAKLDQAQAAGQGATTFEDAMIDEAMRVGAQRIVARASDTP